MKPIKPVVPMIAMLVRVPNEVHEQVLLGAVDLGISPYAMHQRVLLVWATEQAKRRALKATARAAGS